MPNAPCEPAPIRSALVLANSAKAEVRALAAELVPWLRERVEDVELEQDIREFCARREALDDAERGRVRPDLLVVLGGDGALLGSVRAFALHPVPALGINLGRVGFLASTPASRWRDTLEDILRGSCEVELRTRLACEWEDADGRPRRALALNEVAFQRSSHEGMLRASLAVDDLWVTDYRADGLLVATPSGSTAYSLSAGGPILDPGVDALVVTPICSQGLSNRPIVVGADGRLEVRIEATVGTPTLAVDGQSYSSLAPGGTVRLHRHPVRYPLYAMAGLDPYRRLRERLGWGLGAGGTEPAPDAHS